MTNAHSIFVYNDVVIFININFKLRNEIEKRPS